mgnify:CR=1 FL=1
MHPDFNHAYKRYILSLVILLLYKRFVNRESRYAVCSLHAINPCTLRRWEQGFTDKQAVKHVCFFVKSRSPPEELSAAHLLNYFTTIGEGDTAAGAAVGMTRLEHGFQCRLY